MSTRKGPERYSLTPSQSKAALRKLARKRNVLQRRKRYGVYEINGSLAESDVARSLECEVFFEYFGNDAEEMHREYGVYEEHSEFIVVVDHRRHIAVGVVRLIKHSEKSLKTFVDTTDDLSPWKLSHEEIRGAHEVAYDKTWDIATIAVKRRYRSKLARRFIRSLMLHALHRHALSVDAEHWVALLDDIHLKTFREIGIPIDTIAGSQGQPYLGSKSTTPIIVRVRDVGPGVKKKSRMTHSFLIKGKILRRFASFS